jgi:hypothetical protein
MAPGTVALNIRQHVAAWSVEDDHQDVAAHAAGVAGRYRLAPARDGADTPAGAAASVTGDGRGDGARCRPETRVMPHTVADALSNAAG